MAFKLQNLASRYSIAVKKSAHYLGRPMPRNARCAESASDEPTRSAAPSDDNDDDDTPAPLAPPCVPARYARECARSALNPSPSAWLRRVPGGSGGHHPRSVGQEARPRPALRAACRRAARLGRSMLRALSMKNLAVSVSLHTPLASRWSKSAM